MTTDKVYQKCLREIRDIIEKCRRHECTSCKYNKDYCIEITQEKILNILGRLIHD